MKIQEILSQLNTLGIAMQALPNGNIKSSKKLPDDLLPILKTRKKELWNLLTQGEGKPKFNEISLLRGQMFFNGVPTQTPQENAASKTPIDSIETPSSSSNAEILNRLEVVALRAVQFAGKLKDSSPEQNRIAGLLDQAHEIEILEPLDTVKLAKVIGELMAAASQKPEGLKSSEPGQQLLMTGT